MSIDSAVFETTANPFSKSCIWLMISPSFLTTNSWKYLTISKTDLSVLYLYLLSLLKYLLLNSLTDLYNSEDISDYFWIKVSFSVNYSISLIILLRQ